MGELHNTVQNVVVTLMLTLSAKFFATGLKTSVQFPAGALLSLRSLQFRSWSSDRSLAQLMQGVTLSVTSVHK
jgi:hypothetical protein